MKILITGANGFVGRQIVKRLAAGDHQITAMDFSTQGLPSDVRCIEGDLSDTALQKEALSEGIEGLIHLATVPGGAAEADPAASRRVNIDAMYNLLENAAEAGSCPRIVYASSIAVLGHPLPSEGVDDTTPLSPELIYGGHKAMMEVAIAMLSNRKAIDGVSIRLPGILARPKGPSGMKSAFMSDLFHALKAGETFTCPTRPEASIWAQSVDQCAANFIHGLTCDTAQLPPTRAVTLPAQHIVMSDLAAEIASQCGTSTDLVTWAPDTELEAAFGAYPPLATPAAKRAGFADDENLANLVCNALKTLT